jgi:hypothetical protein
VVFFFKKRKLPIDFDWKYYLSIYADLKSNGLTTERDAIKHYHKHGRKESREYKKPVPIESNEIFKGSSVFICGTSQEIEILKDSELAKKIEDKFFVFCINSSYLYFNNISRLFLSARFIHLTDNNFKGRKIDEIFIGSPSHLFRSIKTNVYSLLMKPNEYQPKIDVNINNILPHGPTTMLDIVFPFCCFNGVKNIYILGAEYPKDEMQYQRHIKDKQVLDRSATMIDRSLEMKMAHDKLNLWDKYFRDNEINCFALSANSETPFEKINLLDIL